MIYVCLAGEVVKLNANLATISCAEDGERVEVIIEGDQSFELKVGDSGIFAGYCYQDEITVSKIELKKFLDPYYQKDLMDGSSKILMIPLIKDPFPAIYVDYMKYEKSKTIETVKDVDE